MTTDVLYLTWNRLEFTRVTLAALLANTDWDTVRELVVYDDGSEDGTRNYVADVLALSDVPYRIVDRIDQSPVRAMSHYLADRPAEWFAKIDNDVAVPAGWLEHLAGVIDRNDGIDLLGMEAGMTRVVGRDGDDSWDGVYGFEPSTHIGGVGLMRTAAFEGRRLKGVGRNGFTEFQHTHRPVRGWITPDLPVPLLDRLPIEPFVSLSAEYVAKGWQRPWPAYDPVFMAWAFDWLNLEQGVPA